MQKLECG